VAAGLTLVIAGEGGARASPTRSKGKELGEGFVLGEVLCDSQNFISSSRIKARHFSCNPYHKKITRAKATINHAPSPFNTMTSGHGYSLLSFTIFST
jgi:hypothetical protein